MLALPLLASVAEVPGRGARPLPEQTGRLLAVIEGPPISGGPSLPPGAPPRLPLHRAMAHDLGGPPGLLPTLP